MAKKYHDKLFKEYCICDLRKYKENKVEKLNTINSFEYLNGISYSGRHQVANRKRSGHR